MVRDPAWDLADPKVPIKLCLLGKVWHSNSSHTQAQDGVGTINHLFYLFSFSHSAHWCMFVCVVRLDALAVQTCTALCSDLMMSYCSHTVPPHLPRTKLSVYLLAC